MSFRFGRLPVGFSGHHGVVGHLQDEYSGLPGAKGAPEVLFHINSERQARRDTVVRPGKGSENRGKVWLDDRGIFIDSRTYNPAGDVGYAIRLGSHPYPGGAGGGKGGRRGTYRAEVFCDGRVFPGSFKERGILWYERQRDWNYLPRSRILAKNLVYDVIEPIVHMRMLSRGCAFMHASGIADGEGEGVLFSGEGGVGKSTACISLLLDGGWRFLADDLCLIDDRGKAYCYPKRMQIYAYNTRAIPGLYDRLFSGRGLFDTLQWHYFRSSRGPDKVRRRVSPEEIFGEGILAPEARISRVLHLRRAEGASFQGEDVGPARLARICRTVIRHELRSFFTHMEDLRELDRGFPAVEEVLDAGEEVYRRALARADCSVVGVPPAVTGGDIKKYIAGML